MGMSERQEQQQHKLTQAYHEVKPRHGKMDGIDQAYVWARTFTPSWVMGIIFLVGICSLAPMVLKKFGININISRKAKPD